jgi:hypothetical protein
MEWIAYCITCQKELDRTVNGAFAEGAARHHLGLSRFQGHGGGNPNHVLIVGFQYKENSGKAA